MVSVGGETIHGFRRRAVVSEVLATVGRGTFVKLSRVARHDREEVTVSPQIRIDQDRIAAFCRRWNVTEFSLFGSVVREDFRPDSDVDVLVSFSPEAPWHLMHLVEMREELERIFGREVDLVEKRALRNPFRRHEILTTMQTLYAA